MDFIDTAVSKTKEAFDLACKKTNEVVGIQKLKFEVSALESKRAKDFEALGELYYEKLKNEEIEDSAAAELVSAIKQKTEKIVELRSEILSAKNRRVCHACGASIEGNSRFCNICGAKVTFESE